MEHQGEKQLQQIVNNIDGVFWLMSADKQKVLYVSPAYERIFGETSENLLERLDSFIEHVHEDDREMVIRGHQEFLETGEYAQEYRIVKKDKSVGWINAKAFPVKDNHGNITRYAGILTDISKQKSAEMEAREQTERLDAVLAAIPDMFFLMDKDGTYLDVIATDPDILLAPREQLLGKKLEDFLPAEEARRHLAHFNACLSKKELTTFEYQLEVDGRPMHFEARLKPIGEDKLLAIVRDTTETKNLADSYINELELRQFLFNKNRDGLLIINNDHKVLDANDEFCRMLGYSADEIKELYTWDYEVSWSKEEILEGIDTSVDVDTTFESRHKRKDGSVYDVEISARSIHWKGERLVVCTCRDITGRKRLEREILQAKNTAEANQRRFEEIAEYTGEFIWEVDNNGVYTYANQAVEKILGYRPDELVGKLSCFDLVPDCDRGKLQGIVGQLFKEKKTIHGLENMLLTKSGQEVHVITNGIPVLDHDGNLVAYRGSDRDVTDRKLAEVALRESEEKYVRLARNLRAGIVVHEADTSISFCNQEASRLLGLSMDQLHGRVAKHPGWHFLNDREERIEPDQYPVNLVFSSRKPLLNKAFGIVRSEVNDTIWVIVNAYPEFDSEERMVQVVVTFTDITQLKLAQKELKEYEVRNNQLLKQTRTTLFEISPEGLYTYVSPSVEEMTGYKPTELVGQRHFFDIVPLRHREELKRSVFDLMEAKQSFTDFTSPLSRKDGTEIWMLSSAAPMLRPDGSLIGYRGSSTDITDRKKAQLDLMIAKEKAEEASKLKTAFIDNISHEIRTPLNGIVSFGQLIAQSNLTREQRMDYFNILKNSTNRLIQTVTDFMDISKIASGNMKVNAEDFPLNEVMQEQLDRFSKPCSAKNVDLRLELPDGHDNLILHSDNELLNKVLGHLLGNAEKFTEQGLISFGYQLKASHIEFFVKDQGKGIAPEKLTSIFEAFAQADTEMTRGYEGSGLGLAISKGIMDLLGGKIWATSTPGLGSEFYFTIPKDAVKGIEKPPEQEVVEKEAVDRPLVLIAEDDESSFSFMEIVLQREGCTILYAKNGLEAVELCKANPGIHLVLMDIKMPVMNGLEATRQIREFNGEVPIIAVTAYIRSGEEHLIRKAGCTEYHQKPFSQDQLLGVLKKHAVKPSR